jgi:hypothetical protein
MVFSKPLVLSLCFLVCLPAFAAAEWVTVTPGVPASGNVEVLSDHGSVTTLEITVAGFKRHVVNAAGIECVQISMPNLAPTLAKGEPEVPIWARSVIVPDQGDVTIRIVAEEWEESPSLPVLPSKGNLPRTIDPAAVPYEFGPVYQRDEWSPARAVSLSEPFVLRDFRGVTVLIHPVQYNGARRLIRVLKQMTLEVQTSGVGGMNQKIRDRALLSREFLPLYESMFLNLEKSRYVISEHAGRMLIIAADQFYDGMTGLATWKEEKGIDTELVRYSEIGGTGATAIKNYIQQEYDGPGVTFILLVGDLAHIPSNNFAGGEADPMYTLLEGGDVYPDAFISRFSVENDTHVQTMVERSVGYEAYPTTDVSWYRKATGIASAEGSPPDYQWMNGFRDKLLDYTYSEMDQIYDPGASASQVTNALNDGRSLVLYMGHGSTTSWSTTGFSNSHVNALNNVWMLPVISSVACVNGNFSSTCFAEAWLRATSGDSPSGAVAFYGSSINQSWVPPQYGQQGFVDSLVNDRYNTVGGTLFMGSVAMLEQYGGGYAAQEMFNTWHIFGDCSVQMRTDVPAAMAATYPSAVPVGTEMISVTVSGVPAALVAFSDDGELLGSGYTDNSGNVDVTLDVPPVDPGTILITITAYNKEPVVDDVIVMAPDGPYVIYSSNTVLGDGQADIGESVSLNIELENVGNETAPAVQGALSTAEPLITITGPVQNYGDIAAGATALPYSPFTFDVGALDDETMISFDLDITSGDSLWEASFGVTIHAPILAEAGWQIQDQAGNGNGLPDPGETVDLSIVVGNSGSGDAEGAQLTLDDSDPYVTITGPATQSLGTIPAGGQVTSGAFVVSFDASCPDAYPALIPLQFTSNNGVYAAADELVLVVGQHDLLFVDTDNEATEGAIVTALNAWGGEYTRLNAYNQETVLLDTLMSYRMIVWAAGDQNVSSLTPANQANMASYLDQGGTLLFTAENYLSDYGSAAFTADYLHVSSYQTSISGSTVNGEPGDPIGDDVSVTLSYPSGLAEYPDRVTPDAEASVVFRMADSNDPVAIRYPGSRDRSYKVVFFAAPLEAFPVSGSDPNNVQTVMARALDWLGGGDVIAPTTPQGVSLTADGTLSWSPSSDNVGVDHYCVYRQTTAHFDVMGLTPVRITTGTSESFPGSVGDPDTNYFFRVTAVDAANNESSASSPVGEFDFEAVQ